MHLLSQKSLIGLWFWHKTSRQPVGTNPTHTHTHKNTHRKHLCSHSCDATVIVLQSGLSEWKMASHHKHHTQKRALLIHVTSFLGFKLNAFFYCIGACLNKYCYINPGCAFLLCIHVYSCLNSPFVTVISISAKNLLSVELWNRSTNNTQYVGSFKASILIWQDALH